jgi:hypothetical protein
MFHTGVLADMRYLNAKRQILKTNKKWAESDERKLIIVQDFANYHEIGNYLAAIADTLLL